VPCPFVGSEAELYFISAQLAELSWADHLGYMSVIRSVNEGVAGRNRWTYETGTLVCRGKSDTYSPNLYLRPRTVILTVPWPPCIVAEMAYKVSSGTLSLYSFAMYLCFWGSCYSVVHNSRDANETFSFETETRGRCLKFCSRPRRDLARFSRDETETIKIKSRDVETETSSLHNINYSDINFL